MQIFYETGYIIIETEEYVEQEQVPFKEALEYALKEEASKIEVISHGGYTFKDILHEMKIIKEEDIIDCFTEVLKEDLEYEEINSYTDVYEYVDEYFRTSFCHKIASKIEDEIK